VSVIQALPPLRSTIRIRFDQARASGEILSLSDAVAPGLRRNGSACEERASSRFVVKGICVYLH
jgi:hypothetical protein